MGLLSGVRFLSGQKDLPEFLGDHILIGGFDFGLDAAFKVRNTLLMTSFGKGPVNHLIQARQPIGNHSTTTEEMTGENAIDNMRIFIGKLFGRLFPEAIQSSSGRMSRKTAAIKACLFKNV